MQLYVLPGRWGVFQPNYIKTLLKDVASHLNRFLRSPFEGIIHVEPSSETHPRAPLRESSDKPFVIRLSVNYWCQFPYQFAHEFCHVLSGYECLEGNPNNWFHEAICELASVFTLRHMAERWKNDRPYPNWADCVEELENYSQYLLSRPQVQLPEGVTLQNWLLSHEETLRRDRYWCQRKGNDLVAYKLLPIFESDPSGWNAIQSLPDCSGCLEEYFANWHSSADPADKDFITRLSNAFDYSIG